MNGTGGYEEAAGQGLIAGLTLPAKSKGKIHLSSNGVTAIGVMIDDLVTKGTTEPYRL